MKRGALRRVSAKRSAKADHQNQVRVAVFIRDGWRCQAPSMPEVGECFGPLTVHHLRKASQGGRYEAENLLTLCARHNDWVEDNPLLAYRLRLVRRAGD